MKKLLTIVTVLCLAAGTQMYAPKLKTRRGSQKTTSATSGRRAALERRARRAIHGMGFNRRKLQRSIQVLQQKARTHFQTILEKLQDIKERILEEDGGDRDRPDPSLTARSPREN